MTKRFEPVDPKVSFPELEREHPGVLEGPGRVRAVARPSARAPRLDLLRGTADRQRQAGRPPRGVANLQGRLPALQDDDRATSFHGRAAGTATASRSSSRWRRRSAPRASETSRRSGSPSSTSGAGSRSSATSGSGSGSPSASGSGSTCSDAYWTMSPDYIESVWWSLKRAPRTRPARGGRQGHGVLPPVRHRAVRRRGGARLPTVDDPSVFVRFPILEAPDPTLVGASLLVWTTTPWTLPSNTGAAVAADAEYVVVEVDGERLIVAAALARAGARRGGRRSSAHAPRLGAGGRAVRAAVPQRRGRAPGGGGRLRLDGGRHRHRAPGARVRPRGPRGRQRRRGGRSTSPWTTTAGSPTRHPEFVRGSFVKDADPKIVEDLRARGVLFREETYEHTIRSAGDARRRSSTTRGRRGTSAPPRVKDRLLEVNEHVNWFPEHIKHGRYGQLAREQRRLGAVARALLGHPAADLALRRTAT